MAFTFDSEGFSEVCNIDKDCEYDYELFNKQEASKENFNESDGWKSGTCSLQRLAGPLLRLRVQSPISVTDDCYEVDKYGNDDV